MLHFIAGKLQESHDTPCTMALDYGGEPWHSLRGTAGCAQPYAASHPSYRSSSYYASSLQLQPTVTMTVRDRQEPQQQGVTYKHTWTHTHTLRLVAAAATECNVKSLGSRAPAPSSASVSQRRSSTPLRLIAAAATECNAKSLGKPEPTSIRRNLLARVLVKSHSPQATDRAKRAAPRCLGASAVQAPPP